MVREALALAEITAQEDVKKFMSTQAAACS